MTHFTDAILYNLTVSDIKRNTILWNYSRYESRCFAQVTIGSWGEVCQQSLEVIEAVNKINAKYRAKYCTSL